LSDQSIDPNYYPIFCSGKRGSALLGSSTKEEDLRSMSQEQQKEGKLDWNEALILLREKIHGAPPVRLPWWSRGGEEEW
jgi:hypothetical protein